MDRSHRSPRAAPHIVMIVADYVPAVGGTTTQTRMHAREFARRGWRVTILTRRLVVGNGHETVDGLAVQRLGLPGRGRLAKLPLLVSMWWWLLRRRRAITAVSVVMEPDFALCAALAGLRSSTILTWVTDGDATRTLQGGKGALRRLALRDRPQFALTPRMHAELRAAGLTEVHVVPVPVDLDRFREPSPEDRTAARRTAGIDSGPVITFVGHLQERKGVDRLLVAMKRLVDSGLEPTLLLVGGPVEAGDHQYVRALHDYVAQHELEQRVRFVGPHADVVPYLHASDVFCLPSHREGMPNVLLEAMACGLPCIAPRDAGGDALLGDGCGYITASNEPAALGEALSELLADTAMSRRLAEKGKARVRSEHTIGRIVDAYEAVVGRPGSAKPTGPDGSTRQPLAGVTVHR